MLALAGGLHKISHKSAYSLSEIPIDIIEGRRFTQNIDNANLSDNDIDKPAPVRNFAPDKNNLRFSLNLLQESFGNTDDNIIISPVSFYITALLLANGAEGKSLAELKKMLLLPDNDDIQRVNQNMEAYLRSISSEIEINSYVWADKLTSEYKKAVKPLTKIKSRPRYTDKINAWIADKTAGRISGLVANRKTHSGEIFMVNTVYFKDKWEYPFDETGTEKEPFYSLGSSEADEVYMMHKSDENILYYEDDKMQSVKLPYRNGGCLRIFLPRKEIDFATFLRNLQITDIDVKYSPQYVSMSIPRFEIDRFFDTTEMTELFKQLGVINLFKRYNIDFNKLGRGEKFLAELLHEANIKVDEEGTEASAATYVGIMEESIVMIDKPMIIFKADHPFVFMINDGLFIGVYVKGDMQ